MTQKVVFIDRDGVINWDPIGDYIKRPEDFRFLPGVDRALKQLTDSGYKIIVVSNQAGVGDGVFTEKDLNAVNQKFLDEVKRIGSELFAIFYCLHGKKAGCLCRKPEVGLFHQAVEKIGNFDVSNTFFIGDKITDIEAGKRFGLKTIFVLTGHGALEESKLNAKSKPDFIAPDLEKAVQFLLREQP